MEPHFQLKGNRRAKFAFLSSYGCINKADKVSLPQVNYGLSKTIVYISSLSGQSFAYSILTAAVQHSTSLLSNVVNGGKWNWCEFRSWDSKVENVIEKSNSPVTTVTVFMNNI